MKSENICTNCGVSEDKPGGQLDPITLCKHPMSKPPYKTLTCSVCYEPYAPGVHGCGCPSFYY